MYEPLDFTASPGLFAALNIALTTSSLSTDVLDDPYDKLRAESSKRTNILFDGNEMHFTIESEKLIKVVPGNVSRRSTPLLGAEPSDYEPRKGMDLAIKLAFPIERRVSEGDFLRTIGGAVEDSIRYGSRQSVWARNDIPTLPYDEDVIFNADHNTARLKGLLRSETKASWSYGRAFKDEGRVYLRVLQERSHPVKELASLEDWFKVFFQALQGTLSSPSQRLS